MSLDTNFMAQVFKTAIAGVPVTLQIVLVALIVSLPIGFIFALVRIYRVKILSPLVRLYVSFVRGTPLIAQILIIYSAFPSFLATIIGKSAFSIDPINYAYIVFTLNSIATLTEVFRSALQTVDKGQLEAGLMVGMAPRQTFVRVILPQALVSALPNITNATLYLIKNSSLAFIMSVKDITAIAKTQAAFSYNFLEAYLVVWVYYLIIAYAAELLFWFLERYFSRFQRTTTAKSFNWHLFSFKQPTTTVAAVQYDPKKELVNHAHN
ncbi:amino acid ABC superfamily ATP binding cassette transporter, membrane protein [Agrilactobacillus composti DSM 18527 = JCM 14202]|uniref:Amino acid ABC superfamily ATP binding cassette transporter, membrane protein n=1 Tax=Agrilactobacillus composti DSM 18527 = JCM 14202 TaxID=1423734 RepID=X0PTP5_9LACO|nr:amino acid ABC transporter permease [Agrilactobacillus composti]KRM33315.1 amino acid ABC superfamily ATP binding cassette transporter, membrane protein [Agrilactobacillus composti DSM 18527 = JCM 14202]GAF40711.1 amino acid ABC transporter, permease protein [Agrilactobacillus composti DSM 18527 = JCM 14202]